MCGLTLRSLVHLELNFVQGYSFDLFLYSTCSHQCGHHRLWNMYLFSCVLWLYKKKSHVADVWSLSSAPLINMSVFYTSTIFVDTVLQKIFKSGIVIPSEVPLLFKIILGLLLCVCLCLCLCVTFKVVLLKSYIDFDRYCIEPIDCFW